MTFNAFLGSLPLKNRLLDPVRQQWAAHALAPNAELVWNDGGQANSIAGSLAKTQDRQKFEERTGIPADLAQLCELLVAMGSRRLDASGGENGFLLEGADVILAFGTEWLDAIRPGEDLGLIVPLFARHCLYSLLRPDFALAEHVSLELFEVSSRILSFWDRELAGQDIPRSDWRQVQRLAMQATTQDSSPWGYGNANFIEAIAWPVRSVSREFVVLFEPFLFNWLLFLESAFMTAGERIDREHMLLGWKAMAIAPRDETGNIDGDPLEQLPESARVMSSEYILQTMDRMKAVREAARGPKDQAIRQLMDTLLNLIRSA